MNLILWTFFFDFLGQLDLIVKLRISLFLFTGRWQTESPRILSIWRLWKILPQSQCYAYPSVSSIAFIASKKTEVPLGTFDVISCYGDNHSYLHGNNDIREWYQRCPLLAVGSKHPFLSTVNSMICVLKRPPFKSTSFKIAFWACFIWSKNLIFWPHRWNKPGPKCNFENGIFTIK